MTMKSRASIQTRPGDLIRRSEQVVDTRIREEDDAPQFLFLQTLTFTLFCLTSSVTPAHLWVQSIRSQNSSIELVRSGSATACRTNPWTPLNTTWSRTTQNYKPHWQSLSMNWKSVPRSVAARIVLILSRAPWPQRL
jgi:hypothetical protein